MSAENSPSGPGFATEAGPSLAGASLHVGRGLMATGHSQIHVDGNVTYNVTSRSNPDLLERLIDSLKFDGMDDRRFNVANEFTHTCQWLLKTTEWQTWQESFHNDMHPRLLWIKGKAGTGKSTLMKYAVERGHTSTPGEIVLVHFFNARGGELDKSTEGMYRTLLVQLIETLLPDPKLHVKYVRSILPHGNSWRLGRLKELFNKLIRANTHKRITCFVDALDECDEAQGQEMIEDFCAFIGGSDSERVPLRICLASRYFPNIMVPENPFHHLPLTEQSGHKADIARYIEQKLKVDNKRLSGIIRTRLLEKANGVFLWCALVISIVNKKARQGLLCTKEEVESTLKEIPEELSDLLESILGLGKSSQHPPDARLLLCMQWTLFVAEPLSPAELWEAVHLGDSAYQGHTLEAPSEGTIALFILNVSRGLVEIGQKNVQVIHESVRDFLLNEGGLARLMGLDGTSPKNRLFAEAFSHDALKDVCPARPFVFTELFRIGDKTSLWQPLLVPYAVKWMLHHANAAQKTGLVDQSNFLEGLRDNWAYWHWALGSPDLAVALMNRGFPDLMRLQCLQANKAQDGSIKQMLQRLAASGCYINVENWYFNCAKSLHALIEEHCGAQEPGTRRYILEQIAVEIDWDSFKSRTAFGHHTFSMLFRLLARSVSIGAFFLVSLAPKERIAAMCRVAGFRDFPKMLTAILRTDVCLHDIFGDSISGSEVLCWAASMGHCDLVRVLLEEPDLDVNTCWDRATPLHWAVQARRSSVVNFLLSQVETDVNCFDRSERTPLHMAVEQGDHDTLRMLLERPETNVNIRKPRGKDTTPLQAAVQAGDVKALRLLLTREEIELNTWDQSGETPLMSAIASRNKECLRLLLRTGRMDVNRRDRWGWTFLHWAVISGDVSIIQVLLDTCKLDLDAKDDSGLTSKELALSNGHKDVFDMLVRAERSKVVKGFKLGGVLWRTDDMKSVSHD